MIECAHFVFTGRLGGGAFVEFATHRAGQLALRLTIGEANDRAVSLVVQGAGELVDAFEMACSLGPYDCIVLDIVRSSLALQMPQVLE
jgi:acylphosphatase